MSNENEITIAPGLWKRLEGAVSGRRVLKALSVQQPFANLIADGSKTIEIRPRGTTHRGPLPDCFQQAPGRAAGWVCSRRGEPRRLPSDDHC